MPVDPETELPAEDTSALEKTGASALQIITWVSIGVAVAAIGVFVGAELRSRYRFNRRTPYDFYSYAGEEHASEFGVGI